MKKNHESMWKKVDFLLNPVNNFWKKNPQSIGKKVDFLLNPVSKQFLAIFGKKIPKVSGKKLIFC